MDVVTIDQVKAHVDRHNVQTYEFNVCQVCGRGQRVFFSRHNDVIRDHIHLQTGCDCAWTESVPITYEKFVLWVNNHGPEARAEIWVAMERQGIPRKSLPTKPVLEEMLEKPNPADDSAVDGDDLKTIAMDEIEKMLTAERRYEPPPPTAEPVVVKEADPYHIKHYDGLNHTPALPMVWKLWVEVVERGHGINLSSIGYDFEALVLFHDETPIGVVTYHISKWSNMLTVATGGLLPEWRGKGLYTRLREELMRRAIEKKVKFIESSTHVNNIAMIKSHAKRGVTPTGYVFFEPVPETNSN